ncbi:hypothetical protein [Hymenobacter metallicola]|uniref:Uncharacterized protein n=1 Tax=Hymenobacter metallicola TaxID=2563114 RepID=A0A4Z0QM32_9BACT|nr:hypothetical protein [Hymenobacter metallicola]TGE29802.1 hypothetical protein E5K02_10185 [Hymenobacter metallicola]
MPKKNKNVSDKAKENAAPVVDAQGNSESPAHDVQEVVGPVENVALAEAEAAAGGAEVQANDEQHAQAAENAEAEQEVATVPAGTLNGGEGVIEEDVEGVDQDGADVQVKAGTRVVEEAPAEDNGDIAGVALFAAEPDAHFEQQPDDSAAAAQEEEEAGPEQPDPFDNDEVRSLIAELNKPEIIGYGEFVTVKVGESLSGQGTVVGHNSQAGAVTYHVQFQVKAADFIGGGKEQAVSLPIPAEFVSR